MAGLGLTGTPDARTGDFSGKTETQVFIASPGVVPIRYVLSEIPNVVPVVTVGSWDIGVVTCRVAAEIPNVVPVREVTTEVPHVKVVLV